MKKLLLFVFIIISIFSSSKSQGLNNNYPIDSTDIKNVFEILGFNIFKFKIEHKNTPLYFELKMEIFQDHKLIDSSNITKFPKGLGINFRDEYLKIDSSDVTLRFYCTSEESSIKYTIKTDFWSQTSKLEFDSVAIGNKGWRAFDYRQPEINKQIPLIVFYAFEKGKNTIHCPAGFPVKDIIRNYDIVAIFYLKLVTK